MGRGFLSDVVSFRGDGDKSANYRRRQINCSPSSYFRPLRAVFAIAVLLQAKKTSSLETDAIYFVAYDQVC